MTPAVAVCWLELEKITTAECDNHRRQRSWPHIEDRMRTRKTASSSYVLWPVVLIFVCVLSACMSLCRTHLHSRPMRLF